MDGTLVNSEPLWLLSEKELMAEFGYQWTLEDQANCLGGPLDRIGRYMHELAGGVNSPEFFTNTLVSLMARRLRNGAELMDGAEDLLDLCQELKVPVALVSASPRILVDAILEYLPRDTFRISVSSDDVVRAKPDPEGYLTAAGLLHVSIKKCLVLEDSATGVSAASASGGCVVAIPHLVPIQESEKVRIVSSVRELTHEKLKSFYREWNN